MFIGQQKIKALLETYKDTAQIPHTFLIAGESGSGRELVATKIAALLDTILTPLKDVADIVGAVELSQKRAATTVFFVRDAEKLRMMQLTPLLKTLEDYSDTTYFILTTSSPIILHPAFISRCTKIIMEPYTQAELYEYSHDTLLSDFLSTPGQILEWQQKDFPEFLGFCESTIKILKFSSGVATLQVRNQVKIKDTDTGYNPLDFLNICIKLILKDQTLQITPDRLEKLMRLYQHTYQLLLQPGIQKGEALDIWLIDTRKLLGV